MSSFLQYQHFSKIQELKKIHQLALLKQQYKQNNKNSSIKTPLSTKNIETPIDNEIKIDSNKYSNELKTYFNTYKKNYIEQKKHYILNSKRNIKLNIIYKKYIKNRPVFPNIKHNLNNCLYKRRSDKNNLIVYVYAVCYNESFIIKHFLKHYDFATKIFIYDNCSIDNTIDIVNQDSRCEVIYYSSMFDDTINSYIKNNCWKQHRGECDYAIVCDMDEFLWYPYGLYNYLKGSKKNGKLYDIFRVTGYNMISYKEVNTDEFLYKQINTGYSDTMYNKMNIFNPNNILEMNYTNGSHTSNPENKSCKIILGPNLYLLHYKYIGGTDRLIKRQIEYGNRLSINNISNREGLHYKANNISEEYSKNMSNSIKLFDI